LHNSLDLNTLRKILKLNIFNTDAIRQHFDLFLKRINSSDGIIISFGVVAIITGVLVDLFVIRLLCLLVVVSSAAILVALYHARQQNLPEEGGVNDYTNALKTKHETGMKTIYFDESGSHQPAHEENEDHRLELEMTHRTNIHAEMFARSTPAIPDSPNQGPPVSAAVAREFCVSDFFDLDSSMYQGDPEPRTEFNFLLHKILQVVKEVVFANSVVFFWANREKRQMVMEARVSDNLNNITLRRFTMSHDLVSRVAEQGKPELLNEVNPRSEQELLAYYNSQTGIKSFVGVPVYFTKANPEHSPGLPVGVIAVDSRAKDAFGPETLTLLGQFTKLISTLIKSYTDKYDLLLDSELLHSIRKLQEKVRNDFSLGTIINQLSEETSKLIRWDHISIVLYDEKRHACVVKKVLNRAPEEYIAHEQAIDFPDSVVGQVIKSNSHQKIDDLEQQTIPRYQVTERVPRKGSFVAVPISSLNKCYGSLNVESGDTHNFSRQDIEVLYRLAENSAFALEILYLEELIREYVIIDDSTGLYSKKFFLQRLHEELRRSDDLSSSLSMLLISIDRSNDIIQRYGRDGFERMMIILSRAVRQSVRTYDLVGRLEEDRFGVILLDTNANDAYLWAEKIRKNVAAHVINLDSKSFSITVSIGLCGAVEGIRKEDLVANAVTVLHRASDAGGNIVRVF
jgi:diguanylate cyclase (GGDEF)-like protein